MGIGIGEGPIAKVEEDTPQLRLVSTLNLPLEAVVYEVELTEGTRGLVAISFSKTRQISVALVK